MVIFRFLSALMAGLLLAAAFPLTIHDLPLPVIGGSVPLPLPGWNPDGYGQVAWLAFIALVPVLETSRLSRSAGEAFTWGYFAGLVWLCLHWMWLSSFGWLPVILLSAWFALPVGMFAAVAHRVIASGRLPWITWGIPAVWCAVEYLRSFGFWAFPWNLLGYSQAHNTALIQAADIGGVYLVGYLIVLANVAVWLVLSPVSRLRPRLGFACLGAVVLCLAFAYGEIRLTLPANAPDHARPLNIALVQGGVDTYDRWSDDRLSRALEAYIPLSDGALDAWDEKYEAAVAAAGENAGPFRFGEMLVIWPETTLPRSMDPRQPERVPFQLRGMLETHENAALLFGAQGRPVDDDHAENGVMLVEMRPGEPELEHHWYYSKVRLVPYGEVVPLREVARFLDYPWGNYDISEGRTAQPVNWRGHNLGLMVCFDNVFSFVARNYARQGADRLVLVTNNSWYDLASGIRQHCDIDILRAVELRRPVLRVSTTGYSHIVSPAGRTVEETDVYSDGLITAEVFPGHERTVYMLAGDAFAQLCLVFAVLVTLGAVWNGRSEGIL